MKLQDLSGASSDPHPGASENMDPPLGVILFNHETKEWFAFRGPDQFQLPGRGALSGLPKGRWLVNLDYQKTRMLDQGMDIALVHDGYLRTSISDIEYAMGVSGRPLDKRALVTWSLVDRVLRLMGDAFMVAHKGPGKKGRNDVLRALNKGGSLATCISWANMAGMRDSRNDELIILEQFRHLWHPAIFIRGRKAEETPGMRMFSLSFPRLSYAQMLTSEPVPKRSRWQIATREADQGMDAFFKEVLDSKRPAIFRADYRARPGMETEFSQAAVNPLRIGGESYKSDTFRSRFLLEDIASLDRFYEFALEGAYVGEGFIPSSIGKLIDGLLETAGGAGAAHASFSAAIAADNILASAYRKNKDAPEGYGESVWIAARDRAAMFPLIEEIYGLGATMVSATLGRVKILCPDDPEILEMVLSCAWEMGVTVVPEDVPALIADGVEIPSDPSRWGGKSVDYPLSSIVHKGARKALWALDGVQDLPPEERAKKFRIMMR